MSDPSEKSAATPSAEQQNRKPPPSVSQILNLLFQTILEFSNGVLDVESMPHCTTQGTFHFRHFSNWKALLANGIPLLLFLLAALILFAITWPIDQAKKSKREKESGWWFKCILYAGLGLTTLPLLLTLFLHSTLLILICFTVQAGFELALGVYGWIKNAKDYLQAEAKGDKVAQANCEHEGKKAISWTLKSAVYLPATIVNCATGNMPALYATSATMAGFDIALNGMPAFKKLFEKIHEKVAPEAPAFGYCLKGMIKFFDFVEKIFSPLAEFVDKVTDKMWNASIFLGRKLNNIGKKEQQKTVDASNDGKKISSTISDFTRTNFPSNNPSVVPIVENTNQETTALKSAPSMKLTDDKHFAKWQKILEDPRGRLSVPSAKNKSAEKPVSPPTKISELVGRERAKLREEPNLSKWIKEQEPTQLIL